MDVDAQVMGRLAKLREPFPPESIGKKPVVTCKACSANKQDRHCEKHSVKKCKLCGNWLTVAHDHLDFVGHAYVRERLLEVDPQWNWAPMGVDELGRPAFDADGGMWMKLTICGVTRIGYGDADGKKGGNARKEAIGDAIRNAGQSFGIALDQWKRDAKLVGATEAATKPVDEPEETVTVEQVISGLRAKCMTTWRGRGGDAPSLAAEYARWSSNPKDQGGRDLAKETDTAILAEFEKYIRNPRVVPQ